MGLQKIRQDLAAKWHQLEKHEWGIVMAGIYSISQMRKKGKERASINKEK